MTEENLLQHKNFINNLKNGHKFSRLGKLFETEKNKYFFDTGTGKVFALDEYVFKILDCLWHKDDFDELFKLYISEKDLINSLNKIKDIVEQENILLNPIMKRMQCNNGKDDNTFDDIQLNHYSIEVTERCNLRCKYCIYHEEGAGFRDFGKKDISIDTLRKAIDLLKQSTSDEFVISFYGGEPLLRFDLIKWCIEYAKKTLTGKKLRFNMTTNATLITDEIADYLSSLENYFTTISLDGPKEINDKNRIFNDGSGAYDKTIEGLKRLLKAEKTKNNNSINERINFNIVLEDTSNENFNKIEKFFNDADFIPKGSSVTTSYVTQKSRKMEYLGVGTKEEKDFLDNLHIIDPFTEWNSDDLLNGINTLENNKLIPSDTITKGLVNIHKRMLINKPAKTHYMNGCCVPASRRLYVTVDGNFAVCERMGPSPFIGNVEKGLDYKAIKKHYIDDFEKQTMKYCNDCWATHMCTLCYTNCYDSNGLNILYRHEKCLYHRLTHERYLVLYHKLLETNPNLLKYLDNIVIG